MDYPPFCKYKHKENNKATAVYEWERKKQKQHGIQTIEKGLQKLLK